MLITLQDTPALRLHPDDDVAIALVPLSANRRIEVAGQALRMRADVDAGHKLALRGIETGQPLRRYGQVIGFATGPVAAGDHVHTHNLAVGELRQDYEVGTDVRPVERYPSGEMRYFDGFLRPDGRVGTRNYVAVISTVNCSASVCQFIRERFTSVFGCKPVPSIKLATNSDVYRRMTGDMDIDCGVILDGTPLETVGRQVFEEVVAVASGKRSKSEEAGVGEEEFAPWTIGPVM